MNIIILHNSYQLVGGEDAVVRAEADLLRSRGHDVHLDLVSNNEIHSLGGKISAFMKAPSDPERASAIARLAREKRADVVHVHNFFPRLTPAVYGGAASAGAAVVQTLHNYRLLCANAMFLRDGRVCEKCLLGSNLWGVVHRCYRGSLPGSLAVVRMQSNARRSGALDHVDRFIALTDFARAKMIEGGLPQDRIVAKPNFVEPCGVKRSSRPAGVLFVGRLSREKGVQSLLEASRKLPDVQLTVIGDGPDANELRRIAPANVSFLGHQPPAVVRQHMLQSLYLIVPSIWYEGFPMTVVEAFSCGLPVIASRIGSLAEVIDDGTTGRLFKPGDSEDLANVLRAALVPAQALLMSAHALAVYESRYTPQKNVGLLEDIYHEAMLRRSR